MKPRLLSPRKSVAALKSYDPGNFQVEINLSANENPYDLPEDIKAEIIVEAAKKSFNRYPDPLATDLRSSIADRYGLATDNVICGNGGDELIQALLLAYGGRGRTAVGFEPTFVMYSILSEVTGTNYETIDRDKRFELPKNSGKIIESRGADIIFLCSPNNPTGNLVADKTVSEILRQTGALVVVDEAYEEFSRASVRGLIDEFDNLIVLRTFSKAFSLAGLRVGYMLGAPEVVSNLMKVKLPYNINLFSQTAATLVMRNQVRFGEVIDEILEQRLRVAEAVEQIDGLSVFPSSANFILVKSERGAAALWRDLLSHGILVRDFSQKPGLNNCLRVTIGKPEENDALIKGLARWARRGEN